MEELSLRSNFQFDRFLLLLAFCLTPTAHCLPIADTQHCCETIVSTTCASWWVLRSAFSVRASHDRAEPQLILSRRQERADHAAIVSWCAVVQDIQPEVITTPVYLASQVALVLHQHERWIVGRVLNALIVRQCSQYLAAAVNLVLTLAVFRQQRIPLG